MERHRTGRGRLAARGGHGRERRDPVHGEPGARCRGRARDHRNVMVAGVAGLVAGAMSMAAGEYVSVHSQADTEQADLELERAELKTDDEGERKELAAIYVARGLDPALAKQVCRSTDGA